jgi:4-hydroxybenzoate polyprenyltransferase
MTPIQRFVIYQRERFPLLKTVPLLAVFSAASINVSAMLADRSLPGPTSYVSGFILVLIIFFQMRATDEWKDQETDRSYRPERPIPRGLIKLRTVLLIALGLVPVALVAAASIGSNVVGLLLLTWFWLSAMTFEFGVPRWLIAHPLVYLISHMAIMPLIDLLLTGIEWADKGGPPAALLLFLALSFVNGCVLEIGRKTWAPESEREGVDTYSKLWGPERSTLIWLALIALSALLLVSVGAAEGMLWPFVMVTIIGFIFVAVIALGFASSPTTMGQTRIDAAAGIWVLICYASAGFLPLLLKGGVG